MNLFCCFRKNKSTIVKNIAFDTVNVLVTEDRFTEMTNMSDYSNSISFFYREENGEIHDLMEDMIWQVEMKNLV